MNFGRFDCQIKRRVDSSAQQPGHVYNGTQHVLKDVTN